MTHALSALGRAAGTCGHGLLVPFSLSFLILSILSLSPSRYSLSLLLDTLFLLRDTLSLLLTLLILAILFRNSPMVWLASVASAGVLVSTRAHGVGAINAPWDCASDAMCTT